MNAAALIERELREESRRPVNYWLRLLAGGVVIAVFALFMIRMDLPGAVLGRYLFQTVHRTMLLVFWVLVPLMTADCISREKREGTLGLLFLTPLTARDVVVGKAGIHLLRALTLYLAAMPVLGLSLMLGGVPWGWLLGAGLEQAGAVLAAMAAGVYASCRGGSMIQVMVMAELYAVALAWTSALLASVLRGLLFVLSVRRYYIGFESPLRLVLAVWLFHHAIRRLRATWQDSEAAAQPRWVALFSDSDFWRAVFHWDTSQTLDRNPMAWLQEYSWTARLTKWGWCLLLLTAEIVILSAWDSRWAAGWQDYLTALLGAGAAFSAIASFRRERQAGLLELLLVTPLSVKQLVRGRFWGLGCHYVPALAILLVGWLGNHQLNPNGAGAGLWHWLWPNPLTFAAVMVFGMYLSLTRLHFLLAWPLAWMAGFVVPPLLVEWCARPGFSPPSALEHLLRSVLPVLLFLLAVLGVSWRQVHRTLERRTFLRAQTSA